MIARKANYPMKIYGNAHYRLFKFVLSTFLNFWLRMRFIELEPIPSGPKVFTINHPTVWDAFPMLAYRKRQFVHVMVEDQIWSFVVPRMIFSHTNQVKLNSLRGDPEESYRDALQALKLRGNHGVLASIEGGLTHYGEHKRARKIVSRLAVEARAPIVPIGVWIEPRDIKARRFHYNYGGKKYIDISYIPKFRARYTVVVGHPINLESYLDRDISRDELQSIADRAMSEVYACAEMARGISKRER
jgi:1-acyl-sn-glycerol-3-phosphate acyltransferase